MFGPSNGQTPRSSTSSNPPDLSSAAEYSRRTLGQAERGESSRSSWPTGRRSQEGVSSADGGTHILPGGPGPAEDVPSGREGNGYRRHRPRNSGGFLLQPAFAPITQPDFNQRRTNHERIDIKGKGRGLQDGISTRMKKSVNPRHRPKTSLGSSPLASEVTNARVSGEEGTGPGRAESPDKRKLVNVGNGPSESMNIEGDMYKDSDSSVAGSPAQPPTALSTPLGLETDPVDIVNLALNLSESRRRTASVSRLSASTTTGNRRVVSMSMASPALLENSSFAGAGGSLRQHLQQQRRVSRSNSPLLGKNQSDRGWDASPVRDGSRQGQIGHQAMVLLPLALGAGQDVQYNFSDATLSRAAKARTTMELFYEYRRLLQYLPPLKQSTNPVVRLTVPQSNQSAASQASEETSALGRRYNPLQYVRNRRLRARKKLSLDAEAAGWGDLERVRRWVDKVAEQSGGAISAGPGFRENILLPDFETDTQQLAHGENPPPSHVSRYTGPKPRHQRLDWMITPADLLADAFWLEQGTNKELIEDKNGVKLLPSGMLSNTLKTHTSDDAGALDKQPLENRGRVSQKSTDQIFMQQSPLDSTRMERGRQRHQDHVSRHSLHEQSISRFAEASLQNRPLRSRTSSGSPIHHGRYSVRRFSDSKKELSERSSIRALLDEQRRLLGQKAKKINGTAPGDIELLQSDLYEEPSRRSPLDSKNPPFSRHNEDLRLDKFVRLPDPVSVLREHAASTPRASLDSNRGKRPGMSVDDLDMTAPSSPIAPNFVPSIAINLSPPPSRSTSPSKNSLKSKLNLLRPERSKETRSIDGIDFALGEDISRASSRQVSAQSEIPGIESTSKLRLPSPSRKRWSRNMNDGLGTDARSPDSRFKRDVKEIREPESRLRGIFKGRRIAELVGNEVSRVGDFFWKRELHVDKSLQASPASSMASEFSDSDVSEVLSWSRGTNPDTDLSRTSTKAENGKLVARKAADSDQPKYHISNLPTFKSPHRENEPRPAADSGEIEEDHITRQQAAQRERGRPARFDTHAPPRIDIRNASPSPHSKGRAISPGPEATKQANGQLGKPFPSVQGIRSPNEQSDPFLGPPGSYQRRGPPVTGLTNLEVSHGDASAPRPSLDRQRQWSISDRAVSTPDRFATKREIAHIRALLLSSGIKAKEICRRANEVRKPSQNITEKPLPLVPRAQEQVLASRVLILNIERTQGAIEEAKKHFADHIVTELHERIRLLDERIQNELTPLVRACADDADAFGAELTTTQTLAVKQLNDSVHQIMRRRRRRLKWIRRAGYVLLEWTLLGIMWWAWLIVVIIRLIRGGVRGMIRAVRWILWL